MQIGDILEGKIIEIKKTHIIVLIEENWTELVHISEISDYFVARLKTIFKINERHCFEIIEILNDKKIKLSWKRLKPRYLKEPFEFILKETHSGFENLFNQTKENIEND